MAGTTYPERLNQDAQTVKTPAYYDSILREWVMLSQMAVLNGAGQPTKAQLDAWNRFAATVYATDGAIDSLGARADVAQTDTTQAATAIALLKGLIELGKTVGTEQTLGEIKTALTDGTQQVQLTGTLEYYGATASERPAVADVPVGAVYMAVRTQEMWQSDGTQWVVM